jgi:hypothetical protein
MDGTRFDELTRRFGAGLSRRQVLRGLVGGAGAITVIAVFEQQAGAQGTCDPNADTVTCPPGSFHAGQTKKPDGKCCNGNGNCCSNVCENNFCGGLVPICAPVGEDCSEIDCCNGLACDESDSTCVEQECQDAGEVCEFDENCCGSLLCVGSVCTPPDGECVHQGEICEASAECCGSLICVGGYCSPPSECVEVGEICVDSFECCDELVCVDYFCAIPDGECVPSGEICEVSAECCGELVCIDYYCGYKLPNTGAGSGSSGSSSLVTTAIAGGAAAVVAAKVLRRKPAGDASSEG